MQSHGQRVRHGAARPALDQRHRPPTKPHSGVGAPGFRWVNGKNSRQHGFNFSLWKRQIVHELVVQRFKMILSLVSIGALLARLGLTPQKPLQRVYQRDPEAIDRWLQETYPAIAR